MRPSAFCAALHQVEEVAQLHVWARRAQAIGRNQAATSGALNGVVAHAKRMGSVPVSPRFVEFVDRLPNLRRVMSQILWFAVDRVRLDTGSFVCLSILLSV